MRRNMEANERLKAGEKATLVSGCTSVVLAIIKGLAGIFTGSIALITSALDSIADIIGMLTSWFGFRISQRKPDGKFPYGYYKAESVATLFISFFILYAAYRLLVGGYERLFVPPQISMPAIALSIAFVSIFISLGLSRYLNRTGSRINSDLLLTNSRERLGDVAATVAVFVAIAMSYLNVYYVEGIVTIIISLLILRLGLVALKNSLYALMDVSPGGENKDMITDIIKRVRDVESFDGLKLRKSGPFVFGEVVIKIRKSANVNRAHEISDIVEKKVMERMSEIVSFIVHVEPYKSEKYRIVIPVKSNSGLDSPLSLRFGRSGYFLFADIDRGSVKRFYFKKNPYSRKAKVGLLAANFVIKEGASALFVKKLGEISFHTLRDHLVDIYKVRGRTAGDVLRNLKDGRFSRLNGHVKTRAPK